MRAMSILILFICIAALCAWLSYCSSVSTWIGAMAQSDESKMISILFDET